MTKIYMSPNKCTYARGKYLLKILAVEVQIETSSRFPVTVDCFFVLHLLINSVIIMVITRKAVERVFILIQFYSYLRKQGCLFSFGALRRIHPLVCLNGLFDFCTPWNWQKIIDFFMVLGEAELKWFAWTRLILYAKSGNGFSNFIVYLFTLPLFIS